ncbi:MAG: hypothetical protein QM831_21085 [Kofleriaceae bacterium]
MKLLAILLCASVASASPYKRPSQTPTVVHKETVKPVRVSTTKPVTADQVMAIDEHQEGLRQEQQQILEGLVRDTPDDDPDKPDYLFRLAEQYAQRYRLWHLKSLELDLNSGP